MKKIFILIAFVVVAFTNSKAQETKEVDTTWKSIYRATTTKTFDLVHTKLDVKFDFQKAYLYGKAWITLQPHFYASNTVELDAKGMDIKEVVLMNNTLKAPLKYSYDGFILKINLNKAYKKDEKLIIYIVYTAKPNEVKTKGSAAINDAKGLYFIDPLDEDKDKPTSFWTQGETEANSVWFPTIDKPGQKLTHDINMTVPNKFVSLSNGLLVKQIKNADGTRTDSWKMDLPHAPYLVFMAAGEFSVVKDKYKNIKVNYYVEKEYESVAKKIFGETPAMIKFFSEKMGVEYPWAKYSQIVGRDFVSGAMENTTATLHQDGAYQNARQLVEGNTWESTIAHELFHHWFGDLVTAESWSNLTVNESFANYSEYLWEEYRHGRDQADEQNIVETSGYLFSPGSTEKHLVRFNYADKEDMFDGVSYNKGGRILHMLRYYVGDDAFFASLNKYLTDNKFKSAESHNLRLAFEEVTGEDLNWFWNQWYFGSGHPDLVIDYKNDPINKMMTVSIKQTQKANKVFKLPLDFDVYQEGKKERVRFWMDKEEQEFIFSYNNIAPNLINVDPERIILCKRTDNKTEEMIKFQIDNAPRFLDRKEALDYFAKNNMPELKKGLKDKYHGIIAGTLEKIAVSKFSADADVLKDAVSLTLNKNKKVVAAALKLLGKTKDANNLNLFKKYVADSSYTVSAASLDAISQIDASMALQYAKSFSKDTKGKLSKTVSDIIVKNATEADFDYFLSKFNEMPLSEQKLNEMERFCTFLGKVKSEDKILKALKSIGEFKKLVPAEYQDYIKPMFVKSLGSITNPTDKVKNQIEEILK